MAPPKTSQAIIDNFWKKYITPSTPPTKASAVLPKNVYASKISKRVPRGTTPSSPVAASYNAAVASCTAKVAQIVRECMAINQKYSDPYFNLNDKDDCLYPLSGPDNDSDSDGQGANPNRGYDVVVDDGAGDRTGHLLMYGMGGSGNPGAAPRGPVPPSVKRVGDIFDAPRFFVDGADAKDIRQGYNGDCWFLSALMGLCNIAGSGSLIEKVCVARDQDVGVYGFVMFRDGEWQSVIVDDKLYLRKPDYEDCDEVTRGDWETNRIRVNSEEEYRKEYQSNSGALWYAQSTQPDETWVPLLEKAYAKAHGDYGAIEGGYVSDGVEDLTGGVSVQIKAGDILSKEKFWQDLLKVNTEYLFGCATPNWYDPEMKGRDGIQSNHAYTILRAVEHKEERLLLVKNPWGKTEWKGPWSDGSREWTAESIKDLGHTFGDDGVFWIRYADLLRKYDQIYRTRLFTDEWRVAQQWLSVAIPWAGAYQDAKFEIVLEKSAQTVIILSQLDDRYFRGLRGQYIFNLSFRVHKKGEEDYIMRTYGEFYTQRSVNTELFLEAGSYEVRLKISAVREADADKVEDVVKENWLDRREKLLRVGLSYDLAHAKAQLKDEEEKETGEEKEKAKPSVKTTVTVTTTTTTKTETEIKAQKKDEKKADEKKADEKKAEKQKEASLVSDSTTAQSEITEAAMADKAEDAKEKPAEEEIKDEKTRDEEAKEDEAKEEEAKEDESEDDSDSDGEEPWGAVAVVGLRVYCRDADATIQVIRPTPPVSSDKVNLDVDDPARDATKAGEVSGGGEKWGKAVDPEEKSESKDTAAAEVKDGGEGAKAVDLEGKSEGKDTAAGEVTDGGEKGADSFEEAVLV